MLDFSGFPLAGEDDVYRCSQGAGGGLTHFLHKSTHNAVDFDVQNDSAAIAVARGVVTEVRRGDAGTGAFAPHLFRYNGVTVRCKGRDVGLGRDYDDD